MAKTLEQGFDTFLSWLAPLASEHDKAKSHKNSVKSCLENNFECYSFFETGSFGNGTGIRHYSDTDYFAVLPSKNVSYDSSATLRKVKEALQETFWSTSGITVNTPAVKLPFGTYAKHKKGAIMGSAEALCWSFEQFLLFFFGQKSTSVGQTTWFNPSSLFLRSPTP